MTGVAKSTVIARMQYKLVVIVTQQISSYVVFSFLQMDYFLFEAVCKSSELLDSILIFIKWKVKSY